MLINIKREYQTVFLFKCVLHVTINTMDPAENKYTKMKAGYLFRYHHRCDRHRQDQDHCSLVSICFEACHQ